MNTITKKDLVDRIAEKTGNKRVVVKQVVQSFLDEIIAELGEGNRLEFRDFGVFEIRSRAARVAQNPKTMEKVFVPSKRTGRRRHCSRASRADQGWSRLLLRGACERSTNGSTPP
jgi:integration host factor subunit beta